MIDHTGIVVSSIARSKKFYLAALEVIKTEEAVRQLPAVSETGVCIHE
jgi:catechol 2,3-dioxygenase-like lactoylglutathione lyase family enzyme